MSATTIYEYDLRGLMTKRTDARGIITTYTYDAAGRLLTRSFPAASAENVTITWDSTASGNHGKGHITQIVDQSGTTAWKWDAYGRLISETKTIGSYTYSVGYTWDASNRLTALTYPSGHIVYYSYDDLDRVTSMASQTSSTFTGLIDWVGYMPFGPLSGIAFSTPPGQPAGIGQWLSFDWEYTITGMSVQTGDSTSTVFSQRLFQSYDGMNLSGIVDQLNSANSEFFNYDSVGRLNSGYGPFGNFSLGYDLSGNRGQQYDNTTSPTVTRYYSIPSTWP